MNIQIYQLVEGATKARGLTVIIDVFRAFSLACYAFDKGPSAIIPVASIEKAYILKKANPSFFLMGERNEQKPEGFDCGNSPTELQKFDIRGRTLIHTTSAGTQGIEAAKNASSIITGSFVNADAIVRYIQKMQPSDLSLVCMGYAAKHPSDEDTFCAEYIQAKLMGLQYNFEDKKNKLRTGAGARFFDPSKQGWSPESDFELCTRLSHFNFVLRAEFLGDLFMLNQIAIR